jgi:hypothetical protein
MKILPGRLNAAAGAILYRGQEAVKRLTKLK